MRTGDTGPLIDNWFVVTLLVLGGYILLHYQRLAKLEKWVRRGTRVSQVYMVFLVQGKDVRHIEALDELDL